MSGEHQREKSSDDEEPFVSHSQAFCTSDPNFLYNMNPCLFADPKTGIIPPPEETDSSDGRYFYRKEKGNKDLSPASFDSC